MEKKRLINTNKEISEKNLFNKLKNDEKLNKYLKKKIKKKFLFQIN